MYTNLNYFSEVFCLLIHTELKTFTMNSMCIQYDPILKTPFFVIRVRYFSNIFIVLRHSKWVMLLSLRFTILWKAKNMAQKLKRWRLWITFRLCVHSIAHVACSPQNTIEIINKGKLCIKFIVCGTSHFFCARFMGVKMLTNRGKSFFI